MFGYTEEELRAKSLFHIKVGIDYMETLTDDYAIQHSYSHTRGMVSMASFLGMITIPEEEAYIEQLIQLKKDLKKKLTA